MQFLKDLLESNITRSVLAVLAICVSFIIYQLNRKRKALSYRIVTKTTLFGVDKEIGGRVQVLLDGEPADKIGLVLIDIENSGNEPIKPEEFVRPLVFTFAPDTRVISADVTAMKPENLGAAVSFEASSVTVAPLLMNSGDEMSIKVLLKQFDGKVHGDARIVGIRDVKRRYENSGIQVARTATWLSLVTTIIGGAVSAASATYIGGAFPKDVVQTVVTFAERVILPLLAIALGYYFGRVREFKKPDEEETRSEQSS
jgi:hypothetical protein